MRVDRESEHQEGKYKERKHERSQNKGETNEKIGIGMRKIKKERNLNRENFC